MDLIYIGKIANTHALKGEIKILSDFKYKEDVFKKDNKINVNGISYTIDSYRKNNKYDMITLVGINNIDDALKLKGFGIYIDRSDYKFSGYLNEDLIGLDVYDNNEYKGKIKDILISKAYEILVIEGKHRHLVPYIDEFVKKIDLENKKIEIKYIKGLDYEN